jgi:hypothetical protein
MTAIALKLKPDFRRQILTVLIVAFLAFALGGVFHALLARHSTVPLNPCSTCGSTCGCPRLSGAIRCGCPK